MKKKEISLELLFLGQKEFYKQYGKANNKQTIVAPRSCSSKKTPIFFDTPHGEEWSHTQNVELIFVLSNKDISCLSLKFPLQPVQSKQLDSDSIKFGINHTDPHYTIHSSAIAVKTSYVKGGFNFSCGF